jgi:hypothetical protein
VKKLNLFLNVKFRCKNKKEILRLLVDAGTLLLAELTDGKRGGGGGGGGGLNKSTLGKFKKKD